MAMIGLRVPADAARLLASVDVPGEKIQRHHAHVTIHMLGDDVPMEQIGKAIIAAHSVAEKTVPFRVAINSVSTFKAGNNGVPVICPVFSPELHELHENLKAAFDAAGVEYSKKWPEFKPHVTLSYSPEPMKDQALGPLEWSAYEMILWGGDEDDQRLSVNLPFSLPGKTAMYRMLIRANIQMGEEELIGKGTQKGWETRREREEKVVREIEHVAPHLLPMWKKLKNDPRFKGLEPEAKAQKFIEYVEEHDGEEMGILQEHADREVARLVKELERKHLDEPPEEPPPSFRTQRWGPSPTLPEPEDWIPFSASRRRT